MLDIMTSHSSISQVTGLDLGVATATGKLPARAQAAACCGPDTLGTPSLMADIGVSHSVYTQGTQPTFPVYFPEQHSGMTVSNQPVGNFVTPLSVSDQSVGNFVTPLVMTNQPLGNLVTPSTMSSQPLGNFVTPSTVTSQPTGSFVAPSMVTSQSIGSFVTPLTVTGQAIGNFVTPPTVSMTARPVQPETARNHVPLPVSCNVCHRPCRHCLSCRRVP